MRTLFAGATRLYRQTWKPLIWTDLLYKVIAFVLLTPLLGVLFRALIALSGTAALSDADLLSLFLGPLGWICFIVVGALWLGIVALEQASLTGILCAATVEKNLEPMAALRFACAHSLPIVQVTMRIVTLVLLAITPFLAIAAAIYFSLLTDHDINYYLKEKPTSFRVALGAGVVLVAALAALLLRLCTSWFFALPLVLFEKVAPRDALRQSAARARGHRRTLLWWIAGWALATIAFSALATCVLGLLGRMLLPGSTESLRLLAVTVGLTMLLGAILNLAVNLLSTTAFATILLKLYLELGRDGVTDPLAVDFEEGSVGGMSHRLTRQRLLIGSVAGILLAVLVGAVALHSVRLEDNVKIMAHRGSSKAAPENTMAAFNRAIEDGADWIELDVQETADGEVVVLHDSDFMKMAGVDLKIWNATVQDLKKIDIGSWFAPEFKEERATSLADVLRACKGKIRVNIELKYYGHDERLEQRVADIVEACGMTSEVAVMSLKMEGVRKMKALRPGWKVGLLMSVSAGNLDKLEADFLAVNAGFANRKLIRAAHRSKREVYVWTVNDAPTMSAMISRGVDGILTDKPDVARSVLKQRARMSVPERLLLEVAGWLGTVPEIAEQ